MRFSRSLDQGFDDPFEFHYSVKDQGITSPASPSVGYVSQFMIWKPFCALQLSQKQNYSLCLTFSSAE